MVSRVDGRLVGVRSASGSAALTLLLELAAARSGTRDIEHSRVTTGALYTLTSRIEGSGPSSSGETTAGALVEKLPSTGAVLSSGGASSNPRCPLTVASGRMLCPCRIACASASASPPCLMFCAETGTGKFHTRPIRFGFRSLHGQLHVMQATTLSLLAYPS